MNLPIDWTGTAASNACVDADIPVQDGSESTDGIVFFSNAPFYTSNFSLTYTNIAGSTSTLVEGTDFEFFLELVKNDNPANVKVYGAIRLLYTKYTGTLTASYQAVGGNIKVNQGQVLSYLATHTYNANVAKPVLTSYPALHIPENNLSVWPLDSLANISTALSAVGFISLGVEFVSTRSDNVLDSSTGSSSSSSTSTSVSKIEGGNSTPVLVAGTVTTSLPTSQVAVLAQESSIRELINAVENSSTTVNLDNANIQIANAAQETGGNLDAISTSIGSQGASTYAGSGNTTLIGVMKGVFAVLSNALNIRSLTSATDTVKVEGGNTTAVKTDGSAVTQPISATELPLPTGAATESGNLATLATTTGSKSDTAYSGTGDGSVISLLKSISATVKSTISIRSLSSATDSVTIQGGNSTAVKVDNSAVTQPVSAATLPLPSNAAQETGGNLAAINTGIGATSDAAYAGSGNATVLSTLKGVYAAIKGTLNTRALSSGTDSVTTVPSGTQAVSVSSLPLPTGAATEGGNLATIVANTATSANAQGTSATGITQMTGGAGILGWLSGIYSKLSNTLTVSVSSLPALPTGSNTIGNVGVNSLPALPAGSNAIGTVGVTSLPSLPAGSNEIGKVTALQNGTWNNVMWGQVLDTPPVYTSGANMPVVLNTSGQLMVDASLKPITIGQSALPSGAATETTLASVPTAINAGFKSLTYWTALNVDGKTRSAYVRQETKDASGVSSFSWFDNMGASISAPASPRLLTQEEVGTRILERLLVTDVYSDSNFEEGFKVNDVLIHLFSVTNDLSLNTLSEYPNPDIIGIQFDLWVNERNGLVVPYSQVKQYAKLTETSIKKVSPSNSSLPTQATEFMPVMGVPQRSYLASASDVQSYSSLCFGTYAAGTGMSVTQSAGSLNVTTGTTASSTTFMVLMDYEAEPGDFGYPVKKFKTPMVTKAHIRSISQRIANQNFSIEIMDEICLDANVTFTSTSTATVVMTSPARSYNTTDVGKKLQLVMTTGSQVTPYQSVTITAATSAYDSVTETKTTTLSITGVNFPASSAALHCFIYGENRVALVWNGTSATNAYAYVRKDGWDKVSGTTITTLTSASEAVYYLNQSLEEFSISDILPTSTSYPARRFVNRYSPRGGLGDGYVVAIVVYNSATAPASTTTFKLDEIEVNNYVGLPVQLANVSAQSGVNAMLAQLDTNSALSTISTVTSVMQLNGKAVLLNASMGYSTAYSLASNLVGAVPLTEYSAQALAAITGTLATSAPTTGGGAYTSYAISLTAWTAGSSTGLCVVLQWSPDNGTTWYDLWHVEPMTAIGVAYIPPLMIPGRRRFRWTNLTGAATTATVTITANELSGYYPPVRQYFDFTAGVLSGTLSAATSGYDVIGCKVINAFVTIGAATTAGTYQLQISNNNGTSWINVGTATQAVADSTIMLSITNVAARRARVICTSAATGQTGTRVDITGCN